MTKPELEAERDALQAKLAEKDKEHQKELALERGCASAALITRGLAVLRERVDKLEAEGDELRKEHERIKARLDNADIYTQDGDDIFTRIDELIEDYLLGPTIARAAKELRDTVASKGPEVQPAALQAKLTECQRVSDELTSELDRITEAARVAKGSRDVHNVYEVLDLIPALRKAIKEGALLMQSIDATQSGHSILEGMHKRQAWLRQWGPEVQPVVEFMTATQCCDPMIDSKIGELLEENKALRKERDEMRTEWGIRSNCDGTHKGPMDEDNAREWVKRFPQACVAVSRKYSKWEPEVQPAGEPK